MAEFGALWWRFATGQPVSGKPRTDATWLRRGTKALEDAGDPFPWSYLPGWKRMLIRWAVVAASVAYLAGVAWSPWLTNLAALAIITTVTTRQVRRWRALSEVRQHRRELVEPLERTLREHIPDLPPDAVDVPLTYDSDHETPVTVTLPDTFAGAYDDRADKVRNIVAAKLAFSSKVTYRFESRGLVSRLVMGVVPQPPRSVKFDTILPALESARDDAPVLGLDVARRPVTADFAADSPHMLISAGSGAGKSVLIRTLVSQILHHGSLVVVIDVKFLSQVWLRGLPGVVYCRSAEMIHNILIALAEEMDRRVKMADESIDSHMSSNNDEVPDTDELPVGRRILIVAEEMNSAMTKLTRYWDDIRPRGGPKRSPAIDAWSDIINMGRQLKINVVMAGQMMTARASGGAEARESFATRALARATPQAWKMLTGISNPPTAPDIQGRWHIVVGDRITETQVAYLSPREARRFAREGVPYDNSVPLSPTSAVTPPRADEGDTSPTPAADAKPAETEDGRPALRLVADNTGRNAEIEGAESDQRREYLTVPEIARAQFLIDPRTGKPARLESIKKNVQRGRNAGEITEFIQRGRNVLYDREALRIWWENRPIMRMTGTTGESEAEQ